MNKPKEREALARQVGDLKTLERAFGKDGVPALLIEQALPEIENQANELLDRLTDGQMSVRFITQRDYKDKNRTDKKETLDILISDAAGAREYELFLWRRGVPDQFRHPAGIVAGAFTARRRTPANAGD